MVEITFDRESVKLFVLAATAIAVLIIIPLTGNKFIMATSYTILIFITLAEAYNILGGYGGYVNFGYSAFYGLGGYITAILSHHWRVPPLLMVPIAGLAVGVISAILGVPLLRLKGVYFAIGMITVNFIFLCLVLLFPKITMAGKGIVLPPPPPLQVFCYLAAFVAVVTTLAAYKIANSSMGLALRGIREDEEVAEVVGVNLTKYKVLGFVASTIPAAVVGGITAAYLTYIDPAVMFDIGFSVKVILMARLGGLGTIAGPLIGALVIQAISYALRYTLGGVLHKIIWGALLSATIILLPGGVIKYIKGVLVRRSAIT
ncbi:MAG: branched-chain amino acid ABC transporter permease [Candidatus Bathyarchaeota archaeon]|nr:branched-chain amino acid ABC transporter permease [Candidatus Bathyarchaeota archaeon]